MKKRHIVLGLLALLSVITYLDRICISVAGPRMQDDLHLSPEQWGWVLSAFIISYGLFEIPTGALGDRIGYRSVLTRVVVWWSAFTTLTGVAWNYAALVATRFFFGAGEAGAYPNISGSISQWFPLAERARAQGIVWGASRIGGALSPLIVVPLLACIGWRKTYYLLGAVGLVWAVVWYAWYRGHPSKQPGVTPEELAEITAGGGVAAAHSGVPWRQLFRSRQLWLIMVMYWCYVWGSMFYITWFPTYLVRGRGLSEAQMGVFAALPFLCGTVGNLLGGQIGDRLVRRYGLSLGRRLMGTTCLLGAAIFLVATALTHGKTSGVIFLALGFGIMDCMLPSAWSLCLDIGGRFSGAVSGAMNTAGSAGGIVCTLLFGYLVESFGNYNIPIFFIALMVAIAAGLFWLIDPTQKVFDEEPGPAA